MQGRTEPHPKGEQPNEGKDEPIDGASGKANREKNFLRHKMDEHFGNFKNWVSLATLLFVAGYTVLSLQQLILSRDTGRRQLRAYVGINLEQQPIISNYMPPGMPIVRIGIRNTGQTPAYSMITISGGGIRPYPLLPDNDYSIGKVTTSTPITLFPGMLDNTSIVLESPRPLTSDEMTQINSGKLYRFFAWGTIYYRDAFRKRHYTNFCINFFGFSPTKVSSEPCNEHNDAS